MAEGPTEPVRNSTLEIHRLQDGYIARLLDATSGHELAIWQSELDRGGLEEAFEAANCDPHEADIAQLIADRYFAQDLTAELEQFRAIGWRAKRGEASLSEIDWIVAELQRSDPRFLRSQLISILGDARASKHEELIAGYLSEWNDSVEPAAASWALIQLGLLVKYQGALIALLMSRTDEFIQSSLVSQFSHLLCRGEGSTELLRALYDFTLAAPSGSRLRNIGVISLANISNLNLEDAVHQCTDPNFQKMVLGLTESRLNTL